MTNKAEQLKAKASDNISERLTWHTAQKDQAGITREMADGKDIGEIYGLGDAGFFSFLYELKVSDLFKLLDPGRNKRESPVEFTTVFLIYLMRIVGGLSFFWHIGPVLLHSQSLMRLVGFNGREVRKGTCERGKTKRKAPSDEKDDDTGNIRGPICPQFIADKIESIPASGLERFFNRVIAILAGLSFFPKQVHALLDASEIESTEKCVGRGKVSKSKAPELRNRKGRIRKVVETVFGFKVWVVWEPVSKLPLAIRFTTIEVADIVMAQEVVEQAVANLGNHGKVMSLAFDRGFIDGKFIWWLEERHIIFYVPAKKNMAVYKDALSLVETGIVQTREEKRSVGYGKNKETVTDRWEAVGIEDLTSAGFYGELGSGSHENRNDFVPNPINAVVVMDDPFIQNNPHCDTLVILTNGPVEKPLTVYDGYDARSEIENSAFREGKQAWFLERPPKNTIDAFRSHVYITMITMALTTAFRVWMDRQDDLESQGKETGIRKFREKVRQENGNKFIVFDEERYAIFDAYEIVILGGRNVRKPRGVVERVTKEDILRKYGAALECNSGVDSS